MSHNITLPAPLQPGDRIAILSPAGISRSQNVYNALPVLRAQGWEPYVLPHAFDRHGIYAGTDRHRGDDLEEAILDGDTRAILCTRGGYGAVHLLERLDSLPIRQQAKWIIGFSDISALHALWHKHGVASIHGPMAKHIAAWNGEDPDSQSLFALLRGEHQAYEFNPHPFNRTGTAQGMLTGGNLAVLAGLIGTPYDLIKPDTILFIEDVSEPVYKIERMMYQLRLSGVLSKLRGLIVGNFTEYSPDVDGITMEKMISRLVSDYDYPVAYNISVGHDSVNVPLIEGATATLQVNDDNVIISQ